MIGKAGGRIDNVTIQEYRFTNRLTAIPTQQERDEIRRQAIDGCLTTGAIVLAVRLSRSIESPSQRYAVQMEKIVEPNLFSDHNLMLLELLSDDFVNYAKTLPTRERLPILAKTAKKIAQIDGGINCLLNQIDHVLREAAKCVINNFQPLTPGEYKFLIDGISEQWGNFTTTRHYTRLNNWLITIFSVHKWAPPTV